MREATTVEALGAAHAWRERLQRALLDDRFVLHFQPIVSLASGEVTCHEALIRLDDEPNGTLVWPGRFLPFAERSGLILEIDRVVLEKVLALLAARAVRGPDGSPTEVTVNLSALSVSDPSLPGRLERRLELHGVDPSLLILELTETAAISDMGAAGRFCARALELGCGVALDDFGAGYGSFTYLKQLPFSHLKIDGQFIRRLPLSRTDQLIVQALARVVRGMGRETVAEFVSDERTLELLRGYGVDYAQGFELGTPRPMLAFAR